MTVVSAWYSCDAAACIDDKALLVALGAEVDVHEEVLKVSAVAVELGTLEWLNDQVPWVDLLPYDLGCLKASPTKMLLFRWRGYLFHLFVLPVVEVRIEVVGVVLSHDYIVVLVE
eukprot:CAMPEP_0170482018 /NCGR_PEP_ID=MMETSP0208-20121228/2223_1 /TAXON_ID=197538 /ORGANISM="Strombidium inclinatum, Strain S3" /LENGTH=114 /DNA_ID=CAMNT_0010754813 /DNA_START=1709 /DNA_END=2053 /DNA_ORIENTATION=-